MEESKILDDPEVSDVEMTDAAKERNRHGSSGEGPVAETGKGHHGDQQNPAGSFTLDGFEDFEEFALDFDDYDLLESIHSHLGSPIEPNCKCAFSVKSWTVTFSKPPSFCRFEANVTATFSLLHTCVILKGILQLFLRINCL